MQKIFKNLSLSWVLQAAVALLILTTVSVLIVDKWIMPLVVDHDHDVTVPNVTGMDHGVAVALLAKENFSLTEKNRFDRSVTPGSILHQSPEAGARVKSGRVIHLIIADDRQSVTVPSLRLSTFRDALFNLQSLGLTAGTVDSMPSNEFPEGVILDQSLPPDTTVLIGTAMNLTISLGNSRTEAHVPYLINRSLKDAKGSIVESGLRLGKVEKRVMPELIPETVLEQSLDSSKIVTPLTPIDLIVSSLEDR